MRLACLTALALCGCSLILDFDQEVESPLPHSVFDVIGDPRGGEAADPGLCEPLCVKLWGCVSKGDVCHFWSVATPVTLARQVGRCVTDCRQNHAPTPSQYDEVKSNCIPVATAYVSASAELQTLCDYPLEQCRDLCGGMPVFNRCLGLDGNCADNCEAAPAVFWQCIDDNLREGEDACPTLAQCGRELTREQRPDKWK